MDYKLSKKMEDKIKNLFIEKIDQNNKINIEDLKIRVVYANDNLQVIFIDGGLMYANVISEEKIDDVTIYYPSTQKMYVYSDDILLTISEAYYKGLLNYYDLLIIANKQNKFIS